MVISGRILPKRGRTTCESSIGFYTIWNCIIHKNILGISSEREPVNTTCMRYSSRTHEEKFWKTCERKCACSKVMSTCCALPRHGEISKWIWVKDGKRGDVLSQVIFIVCRWLELLNFFLRSVRVVCRLKFPKLQSLSADSQPHSGNPKLWDIQHVLTHAASRISFLKLVCSTKMYLLLRLDSTWSPEQFTVHK